MLQTSKLTKEENEFLINVGLPISAAPCLSFGGESSLKTLSEVYERSDVSNIDKIYIGSDGAGSPVCIDQSMNNRIVVCDHDNDFEPQYINSSILTLFEFLTVYKNFIEMLISKRGEDAFFDFNFTDEEFNQLKKDFLNLDKKALNQSSFWRTELDCIWEERD